MGICQLTQKEVHSKRLSTTLLLSVLLSLCLLTGCRIFKADSQVAFLGDSITQVWSYPTKNFGVFGNTTLQMLERAPKVTSGQRYEKVIILGGTNDVLLGVAPKTTVSNLEKIGLAVQRSGAEPVLSEIPPIFHNFNRKDTKDYSDEVRILNQNRAARSRTSVETCRLLRPTARTFRLLVRWSTHEAKRVPDYGDCAASHCS